MEIQSWNIWSSVTGSFHLAHVCKIHPCHSMYNNSFLFISLYDIPHFICSSGHRHLGYFHVLAVINNVAMNVCVHIFCVHIYIFISLGYMALGVQVLVFMVTLCLSFWGTARLFSKVIAPFNFLSSECVQIIGKFYLDCTKTCSQNIYFLVSYSLSSR